MPDRVWDDDPTIPPPGCRSGRGSGSILPYLVKSLKAKPGEQPDPEPRQPGAPVQDQPSTRSDRPS